MATSDFRGLPRRFASKIATATQDTPLPHPHTSQTVQKRAGNEILEPGRRFGPIRISNQNPGCSRTFRNVDVYWSTRFILTSIIGFSLVDPNILRRKRLRQHRIHPFRTPTRLKLSRNVPETKYWNRGSGSVRYGFRFKILDSR